MTGAMVLGKKTIQIDGTERRLIADHRNQPRSRNWGAGGRGRLHGLLVAAHQIRVSWGEVFSHSLRDRADGWTLHGPSGDSDPPWRVGVQRARALGPSGGGIGAAQAPQQ